MFQNRIEPRPVRLLLACLAAMAFETNPAVADTVIIESRTGTNVTACPPYCENAGNWADTTLKSTAPGTTDSRGGGRFATASDASFTIRPTLAEAGGHYFVEVTHGYDDVNSSSDLIMAISTIGGSGLPITTDGFQRGKGVNAWYRIGQLDLAPDTNSPSITFAYSSGYLNATGGRIVADAFRFANTNDVIILSQPQKQTATVGSNATFSVMAAGAPPLAYQWRFNGVNIPGAGSSSLTLSNVTMLNDGFYSMRVSNAYNSILSSPVRLAVNTPGNMPFYFTDFEGAIGNEWSTNKTEVTPKGSRRFLGQFANDTVSLSLSNLPPHTNVTVSFDLFIIQTWNGNGKAGEPGPDCWTLSVTGGPVLLYTTFCGYSGGANQAFPDSYPAGDYPGLTGADETNTLGYVWGGVPVDSVYRHLTYSFPHTNSSVQVVFAGSNLQGIGDESWGLDNVELTLAVDSPTPWSRIVTQPQGQVIPLGSNAAFSVIAAGQEPFSYQWQREGTNLVDTERISGANTPALTITNVQVSDLGAYTVEVTNALGMAVSDVAGLAMPAPEFCWARSGGGSGGDYGHRLAVDSVGNVYVTGWFTGTATFGTNTLTSSGNISIFLVKYDPLGNVLWAQRLSRAPSFAWTEWPALAFDGEDNCYITGKFRYTADFGGISLTSAGVGDIFVAKYNTNGVVQWASRFGAAGVDQGTGIAASRSGDVYVTGRFNHSVSFGSTTLTSAGGNDIFVAKLNSQGNVLWAKRAGGTADDVGTSITVGSDGACYVTGNFLGTASFDAFTLTSGGDADIFVAKYDATGVAQWVRQGAGPRWESGYSIGLDDGGNCFVTGERDGPTTFGGTTLPIDGGWEMFLAKYDTAGQFQWVQRQAGSTYGGAAMGLCTDSGGNTYVAGCFGLTASFNGVAVTSVGLEDAFLAKYNGSGQLQWLQRAGGSALDRAWGIAADTLGNLYVSGEFQNSATFGSNTVSSQGGEDMFVAKLRYAEAPAILVQPENQAVLLGSNAAFSVTVTGAPPFSFQWQRNGTNLLDGDRISGATTPGLSITNVQLSDAGNYQVVVSNIFGAAVSDVATLTIPPFITTQPSSCTNNVGTTATFTVVAAGTEPLGCQWRLNDVNLKNSPHIGGALTSALTISNVQPSDAGGYTVVVSNSGGSVTSAPPALLTVTGAPTRMVTTTNDSGPGSLREALEAAQAGDTILFDPAVFPPTAPATIYLTNALPGIWQGQITIDAANAGVILDGSRIGETPELTLLDDMRLTLDGGTNLLVNGDFSDGQTHWVTYDHRLATNRALNTTDFVSSPQSYQITQLAHDGDADTFYDTTNRSGPVDIWPPNDSQRTMWIPAQPGQQVELEFWIKTPIDGSARLLYLHQDGWVGSLGGTYIPGGNPDWRKMNAQGTMPLGGIGVGVQLNTHHSCRMHHGLAIGSPRCVARGLQIVNFPGDGVHLGGGGSSVECTIGGDRNVGTGPFGQANRVSGNGYIGVNVWVASSNVVLGNYIGTDASGTGAQGNRFEGILLSDGASHNTIGSAQAGENNVISASGDTRIWASGITLRGSGTASNRIIGNLIGVDATGTRALGNSGNGIQISDDGGHTVGGSRNVGTGPLGEGNLISGNLGSGISANNSVSNRVSGNLVGTDLYGTNRLPNLGLAVAFWSGTGGNLIGGTNAGEGNVISGNGDSNHWSIGLVLNQSSHNRVSGNLIGTDLYGNALLGNSGHGIELMNSQFNVIGGSRSVGTGPLGQGNLISGNGVQGFNVFGSVSNQISGNFVGTDITGTDALGNKSSGIWIWDSGGNLIGGKQAGEGNVISGNGDTNWGYGVVIGGSLAVSNQVLGNFIGLNASGTTALANQGFGIEINAGTGNALGGTTPAERNIISGNRSHGVVLSWECNRNTVSGNFIGTDVTGTNLLGNGENGVTFYGGSFANLVGGNSTGAANAIAGNNNCGIKAFDLATRSNTFSRNSVFQNGAGGVALEDGANDGIAAPLLTMVASNHVAGLTAPGFVVEIFSDTADEGRYYEGTVVADGSGCFSFLRPGGFTASQVTATVTDPAGNTSAFGAVSTQVPPIILVQPVAQVVLVSSNAGFSVSAIGTAPLTYQWRRNGTNLTDSGRITGSTTTTLTVSNCQLADTGAYTVVVTNGLGAITSTVAQLTVVLWPPAWATSDVGWVGAAGSASYTNGVFYVRGAGEDIQGSADGFHLVHQPLVGDGQIIARVLSLQNTSPAAEAGVMLRENLDLGSTHVFMAVRQSGGAVFRRRLATYDDSRENQGAGEIPCWLRLMRMGNTFIGHVSTNGVNWELVWYTTLDMPNQVEVGLAVCSHRYAVLNTATFDNVSVGSLTPLTGEWPLPAPQFIFGGEPLNVDEMQRVGGFKVLIGGNVGERYAVEASTNLEVWPAVATLTNLYSVVDYLDTAAPSYGYRFYRVHVVQP